jgi:hypothetical protein
MAEYGENNITIGGVEVSAMTLKLAHIIEYRTPFWYNGTACNLTFGLSEQAAATAIVSINFLRKTEALWSYDDAEPTLYLAIWNTTLKVQYEAPTSTPQDRFRAETTAVYTTARQTQETEAGTAATVLEWQKRTLGLGKEQNRTVELGNEASERDSNARQNNTVHKTQAHTDEWLALHISRVLAASAATKVEVEAGNNERTTEVKTSSSQKTTIPIEANITLRGTRIPAGWRRHAGSVAPKWGYRDVQHVRPLEEGSIIRYDEARDKATLEKSIQQWDDCPEHMRPPILKPIQQYWDVFAPGGLKEAHQGVCMPYRYWKRSTRML